jgi:hypothetical protein
MRLDQWPSRPNRWSSLTCGALSVGALATSVPVHVAAQSRSRYPSQARWTGEGSSNDAANFLCDEAGRTD